MASIRFYEKPGCAGNARQRRLLEKAGHRLEVRDLLSEAWTLERLEQVLAGLPVPAWFNRSAPAVKRGEVVPEELSRKTALALLMADPLLLRRPLIEVGERIWVGFDVEVQKVLLRGLFDQTLDNCPRPEQPCDLY